MSERCQCRCGCHNTDHRNGCPNTDTTIVNGYPACRDCLATCEGES